MSALSATLVNVIISCQRAQQAVQLKHPSESTMRSRLICLLTKDFGKSRQAEDEAIKTVGKKTLLSSSELRCLSAHWRG